jgi:hypothetical protein
MIREAGNGTADNKAAWTGTQAEILALIKQEGVGIKSGVCHNCNKPGHCSRECPEPRKDRGRSGAPNWKKVAPPAGTATIKSVNERTFNWCGKCGRWTTTHDTVSHTGGAGADSKTEANLGVNKRTFNWCGKCGRWTTTHDTVSHTGGAGADSKTEANLGLVESTTAWDIVDPAACNVHIDTGVDMWDVWETFDPYVKLLQFGLLFHFSPIFAAFLVAILCNTGLVLWEQGVNVVVPLAWLAGLLLTLWLGLFPVAADAPEPRWKRRTMKQNANRQRKKNGRCVPGSIHSHGFHRTYPLPLRSSGHYVRNSPKMNHQNAWKYVHRIMGELQHYLHLLGFGPTCDSPIPGKGPQGGTTRNSNSKARRNKGGSKPLYRPVPASGHYGMGNRNFTKRQDGAAKKLHKAYANVTSTEDWSQNSDWSESPDMQLSPSCFRMALQAPAKFRNAMKKESTFSLIWDSGASISISPNKDDFVGTMDPPGIDTRLKGTVKGLSIQ